jgi:adenylate cyclase
MHLLEGISGRFRGKTAPIPERGLRVGKLKENDLVLEDPHVSRYHACFELEEGRVRVRDVGSTNGTFVNDLQIQDCALKSGDEIEIGGTRFRYRNHPMAVMKEQDPLISVSRAAISLTASAPSGTAYGIPAKLFAPMAEVAESEQKSLSSSARDRIGRVLSELARARPGSMSLQESLDRILELVFDLFPVDRGCIVLMNEAGVPVPRTVRHRNPEQSGFDMPISQTLVRRAVEQGTALLVADALADAELGGVHSIVAQQLRCVAYVPICFADQILGLLCVDSKHAGGLNEDDLEALVTFSYQAALVTYQARLQDLVRREEERRAQLQRFLSRSVVDQYLRQGKELLLGGEEREITILFADLRGFTATAEKLQPRETLQLLNSVFERLYRPVMQHRGTLDKYIGDCVMALFGAPEIDEQHCMRAVMAALDMQKEMNKLRSDLTDRYGELQIGIAVNTGMAIVGCVGTEMRMDYTAIGDAVNVAARVESMAGPGSIMITESVAERVGRFFQLNPTTSVQLRGRQQVTQVYSVTGIREMAEGPAPSQSE